MFNKLLLIRLKFIRIVIKIRKKDSKCVICVEYFFSQKIYREGQKAHAHFNVLTGKFDGFVVRMIIIMLYSSVKYSKGG